MQLQTWNQEPEVFQALALFRGNQDRFIRFLEGWIDWQQTLDLRGARLESNLLGGDRALNETDTCFIVTFARSCSYSMIMWLLRQPDWELFYRDRTGVSASEAMSDWPSGRYLPWAYCEAKAQSSSEGVDATPSEGARAPVTIVRVQGEATHEICLSQDYLDNWFKNAFELTFDGDGLHPVLQGKDSPALRRSNIREEKESGLMLPLRTIRSSRRAEAVNTSSEIARMEEQMEHLKDQIELLNAWTTRDKPPRYMYVYREIGSRESGSLWELRSWFSHASRVVLDRFQHVRVNVEGLGTLHLVVANKTQAEPATELPTPLPGYRLRQDHLWGKLGRDLFISDGWELTPAVPLDNQAIQDCMEQALWGSLQKKGEETGGGKQQQREETLIILRGDEDEVHYFTVKGWRPLSSQIQALNDQILGGRQKPTLTLKPAESMGVNAMFELVSRETQAGVDRHLGAMRQNLDLIWATVQPEMNTYRDEIAVARAQIQQIADARAQITTTLAADIDTWTAFRNKIMEQDRELIPDGAQSLRYLIDELDDIRDTLIKLGLTNRTHESRESLTARLSRIMDQIRNY